MPVNETTQQNEHTGKALFYTCALFVITILILLASKYFLTFLNTPTNNFPIEQSITIEEGLTQSEITALLEESNVIRSSQYLYVVLLTQFENSFVQAGTYRFESPLTTEEIAGAITSGTHQSPLTKITLPEGFQIKDIHQYLPERFATTSFAGVEKYEGYLFPDTYHIKETMSPDEIISLLRETFDEKTAQYKDEIETSGFELDEVIILASILEREAKDVESKRIVSGILQNRLRIGMPLQVDAAFDYVLDKPSSELTESDLLIDSPYNTYTHRGLPPTPIANPGIESIEAVLNPTATKNLYYLTGDDGTFHYAKSFDEHKLNKQKYIQ